MNKIICLFIGSIFLFNISETGGNSPSITLTLQGLSEMIQDHKVHFRGEYSI